ncbi:hypothetical protein FQZ97_741120 [compost metagenome]
MAYDGYFEAGIKLTVGGFLVSGMLISGTTYFKEFGAHSAGALIKDDGAEKESVAQSFAQHGDIYKASADEAAPPTPSYIHLRGAKYLGSNGEASGSKEGLLWRVRLSEVSGFTLGAWMPTK